MRHAIMPVHPVASRSTPRHATISTRSAATLGAALTLAAIAPNPANAALYDQLLSINEIRSASNYNYASTHTFDGSTGYFIMRDVESNVTPTFDTQVSKVTNVGQPSQTRTTLVSTTDWANLTGGDLILPGDRAAVLGGDLQFLDQVSDAIYRANTTTGALSVLAAPADFTAVTGQATVTLRADTTFDATGNMYVYDDVSDQVMRVDTAGNVSVFITLGDLQTVTGSTSLVSYVSGGMSFDADDNLFWNLSNTSSSRSDPSRGNIYKRASDGTLSKAVEQADIWPVARTDMFFGAEFAAMNDIILGADSLMYLYDRANDALLRFDPTDTDPASTLERLLGTQDLLDGPMSTENIDSFSVFQQKLTWNGFTANEGIFSYDTPIPTPGTALALAFPAATLLTRRRRENPA